MVINNKATEIGDVLLINAILPIYGVIRLQSFTDTTVGETTDRYFYKEFSFSTDGVIFSDWVELTDSNLEKLEVEPKNSLYINYRYTRTGSDSTGDLIFNDVVLLGEFDEFIIEKSYLYNSSIFKNISLTDIKFTNITANLTKKIFDKGILPKYIIRGETENPQKDDKDFIAFWKSVNQIFALILRLSDDVEKFSDNKEYLASYLRQKDLLFDEKSISFEALKNLASNYFGVIRNRGTKKVFEDGGEFLYFIGFREGDEFFYEVKHTSNIGWCLGKSSPLYKGTSLSRQLVKGVEKQESVEDLDNYIVKSVLDNVSIEDDGGVDVIKIRQSTTNNTSGLYIDGQPDLSKFVPIDESVDYEITFWLKGQTKTNFELYVCDSYGNKIDCLSSHTGLLNNKFFNELQLPTDKKYYFVRGVLYNKNKTNNNSKVNVGKDLYNLRLQSGSKLLYPMVYGDSTGDIYIKDLKVRPLVNGSKIENSISKGFLNSNNLIHVVIKNNNKNETKRSLEQKSAAKLIPYNSRIHITEIE